MAAANSGSVGRGKPFGAKCAKPAMEVIHVTKPQVLVLKGERAIDEVTSRCVVSVVAIPR